MAQTPERKRYMRSLRKNNRPRFNAYYRDYYKKNKHRLPCFSKRRGKGHGTFASRSALGRAFEIKAIEILAGATHTNADQERHKPWDLEWQGKTVDVKVRNPIWSFSTVKPNQSDYMLLLCLNETGEVAKAFLVPRKAQKKSIIICDATKKYEKYRLVL